jgi:hypothetical protein
MSADAADLIYLDDLAEPVLSEAEQQAFDSGRPTELSVEAVLAAARAATGLSDFGAEDFRERLAMWMRSADEDKGLADAGRQGVFDLSVRYAANRLQLEDLLGRHPEIAEVEIDRPIVIAGLPRSGTTHLVNLLAADPRLRSMPLWETMAPFPDPGERPGPIEDSPRYQRTVAMWEVYNEVLVHMSAIHEMAPDHVHEDSELQALDFTTYHVEWCARMPRWTRYYYEHDQTPHYAYERKALQAITWQRGPNRWVMKSPPHMENLIPLSRTFPDATILLTHRDPVAVIQSALTLIAYWDRVRRTEQDLPGLARLWIDRIEHMLRACVRDRDRLSDDQVVDVIFHRYMADQRGLIERIYRAADLELTPEADARITAYLNANPRGRNGRIVHDLPGQFGVDVGALRERFGFYYDRFRVEPEWTREDPPR